jgi:hypothetical protein
MYLFSFEILYRMSNFANLPVKVGLPSEVLVSELDPVMPADCRSNSIRVYAVNNPTVNSTFSVQSAIGQVPDIPFPQTDINFDIPVSQSNDTWLATRLSTLNFRAIITVGTATLGPNVSTATLRSSAYAYFDTLKLAGHGGLLEFFPEWGLTADTIINGQLSNSAKEGCGHMGFQSAFGTYSNTGHDITALKTGSPLAIGSVNSFNYSVPLLSGTVGVLSDKLFPIGLVRKLFLSLTTAPILPYTVIVGTAGTNPVTITVQLTDFWLNLETIKIGDQKSGIK